MVLKIILVLASLVAAILVYAATKPSEFNVQRSLVIHATPEKIFPLINDFHNWSRWAPQDKEDAALKRTYSGLPSGEGASSQWHGTGSSGSGSMEITKSVAFTGISIEVNFIKPFKAHNLNEFNFERQGSSTKVTWAMHGTNLYVMKTDERFFERGSSYGKAL